MSCRFAVLHYDVLRVLHFSFGTARYTVCLHFYYLLFLIYGMNDNLFLPAMSTVKRSLKYYLIALFSVASLLTTSRIIHKYNQLLFTNNALLSTTLGILAFLLLCDYLLGDPSS